MTRQIRFGGWCFDPDIHLLAMGGERHVLEPRVSRLLEYLLEHPGETLSHDQLVDAVWDGRVVSDEAVRRAVSTLRHTLAVDGSDHCIHTVHKKGYVALFDPPEAELLPAERAPAQTPAEHHTPTLWQRCAWALSVAMLVGAVALTLLAGRRDTDAPAATPQPVFAAPSPTLAVLPFVNLGADRDSDILAEGIAGELRDTLARREGLQVTARASAFRPGHAQADVREVARQLRVRYILQGSVIKVADRVRIDTRLTDATNGQQIWSGTHERTLAELFAVQQEIAANVERALAVAQDAARNVPPSPGTASVEAHMELLQARKLLCTWAVADAEEAIEHLQRAITLDANYAPAYAQLAGAIIVRAVDTEGIESVRAIVGELLDRALALDPELGEAYVMRGWLLDDPALQQRELRKGLALSPNYAPGYEILASQLMAMPGRRDEALQMIDRALVLDPLTPRNHHIKAIFLSQLGDIDGAEELERRALQLDPRFRSALMGLGTLSATRGNFAEAVGYGERALAIDPRAPVLREELVRFYLSLAEPALARRVNSPAIPNSQLEILLFEGQWAEAVRRIREADVPPNGTKFNRHLVSYAHLRDALAGGGLAQALPRLTAYLGLREYMPEALSPGDCLAYTDLALLLQASGDTGGAQRLRESIAAKLDAREKQAPGEARMIDADRALLLAQTGRDHDAIVALERAFAPTPPPLWWLLLQHPAFDALHTQPRFKAIVARTEAHVARQQERFAEIRPSSGAPDRAAQNQR